MPKPKKQIVNKILAVINLNDILCESLDDVIKKLQILREEFATCNNLQVDFDHNEYTAELYLHGNRLETDEEFKHRLKIEKKVREDKKQQKELRKARELQELQRLMKKYKVKE